MQTEKLWKIINRNYDEKSISFSTSVFTISNGYMAFKGDIQEYSVGRYRTTIINGLFDRINIFSLLPLSNRERRYLDPEYFDSAGPSPSVANLPDPVYTLIFVNGRQIEFSLGDIRDFQQVYDLKCGTYTYEFEFEDVEGKTTRVSMVRFCDMENVHRAWLRYIITPVNHEDEIVIHTGIDASIRSNITGEKQIEIINRNTNENSLHIDTETLSSGITIHTACEINCPETIFTKKSFVEANKVYFECKSKSKKGVPIVIDKAIIMASSLDSIHNTDCSIKNEITEVKKEGFNKALERNSKYWDTLWGKIDINIVGDELAQRYIRFALYHLSASAPRHSDRLSVPCKLLTGEYYQGTTFYDTDLYIEPFYVFTNPEWAKNCLSYRYNSLLSAKQIAEKLGYKGAKFAWQSGFDGIECLGDWYRFTKTNIHINADIAYSLMLYWYATGDADFMMEKGVDILVETSRFFASRAVYDKDSDAYDYHYVTGPDEGHVGCTNEFYTNYLISKNLQSACNFLRLLQAKKPDDYKNVLKRLAINDEEIEIWNDISKKIRFYFDNKTKVFEQCKDFYKLKPVPEDFLKKRDAWFATVFPYQALNQPDVVMAIALFRDDFSMEIKRANWEFYKYRSMNFSSMSYVINSIMAKEMNELEDAYRDFIISAGMDLDASLTGRNDTHEGLHGTALGGAWMALVFGFGGINLSNRGLIIDPKLPNGWEKLKFGLILHGEWLWFEITKKKIMINLEDKRHLNIPAIIAGKNTELKSGENYTFIY